MDEYLDPDTTACHECDLINEVPALPPDKVARCARCGGVLYRNPAGCIDKSLSLAMASLILFIVANTFPFLGFGTPGTMRTTSLFSGIIDLHEQGMSLLAVIVFATTLLVPALQISSLIYVLMPLRQGRVAPEMARIFRAVMHMKPWGMVEVFLLGILVAFVKLSGMAEIVPGIALWAFGFLIITLSWAMASLEPKVVWARAEALA